MYFTSNLQVGGSYKVSWLLGVPFWNSPAREIWPLLSWPLVLCAAPSHNLPSPCNLWGRMHKHVGFIMQPIYTPLHGYPLASYGPRGEEMCLDGNTRKEAPRGAGSCPQVVGKEKAES